MKKMNFFVVALLCLCTLATGFIACSDDENLIIRKTKCSAFPKRSVHFSEWKLKTKRTNFKETQMPFKCFLSSV